MNHNLSVLSEMGFNFLVIAFQISIDDFSALWEGNGSYMIFTLVKVPCLFEGDG